MWNPCDYKNDEGREKLWKQQEFKEIAWIMAITKLGGDLVAMEHVKFICRFGNPKRWQWPTITQCKCNKP